MSLKLLLLFLAVTDLKAQTVSEDIPIDLPPQDQVEEKNRPVIYNTNYRFKEVEKLNRTLEDILASPTFYAVITQGAVVFDREKEVKLRNPKRIQSLVYSLPDSEGYLYLKPKDGVPRYKVEPKYIERIEEISDLYDEPKTFIPISEDDLIIKPKDETQFASLFTIGLGVTRPEYTRDILGITSHLTETYRFGTRLFFGTPTRFKVGASIEFESMASGRLNELGGYSTQTYSAGPVVSWSGFTLNNRPFSYITELRQTLYSTMESYIDGDKNSFRLRTTSLSFGVEFDQPKLQDDLIFGVMFRRNWTQVRSSSRSIIDRGVSVYDDSIVFNLGYLVTW